MSSMFGRLAPADPPRAGSPVPVLGDVLLLNADIEQELPVFADLLQPAGYRVRACASLLQARRLIEKAEPLAALLRLPSDGLPPLGEIEALLEIEPSFRLIALVEPDERTQARLALLLQRGLIYDFHTLPLDLERLLFALGHIHGLVAVERSIQTVRAGAPEVGNMVGASAAIRAVGEAVGKVARSRAPVLIAGESGTGKELVARAIHRRSERAGGPFIALNCAGLPASLIGSELFGHEKGAFTGAVARKIGRIEAADGGTLFLDEIGDLPLELQGHFLRFLQDGTIDRIGGTAPLRVDVRVLAATHVDLAQAQAEGRFREDLFYRLNVLGIELPPLRARGADIELLAQHFLERFARELGRSIKGFRDSAVQAIRAYDWPGNVRELISCIHRATVMAEDAWITAADLGLERLARRAATIRPTLQEARAELEQRLIREALDRCGHRVQLAARELGISRMTLYRLLERHGIAPEREERRNAAAENLSAT